MYLCRGYVELKKDTNSFWSAWNSNYNESSEIPVRVAGLNNRLKLSQHLKVIIPIFI